MFPSHSSSTASTAGRHRRSGAAGLALGAVLLGLAGCASLGESAPAAHAGAVRTSARVDPATRHRPDQASGDLPAGQQGRLRSTGQAAVGTADGEVPDGVTVFDDTYPAVTRLDPTLLTALRRAAEDAAADGVRFDVNSGWRSRRYQEQLFEQAVSKYGSAAAAARWVARPGTSVHEAGDAVDLGPDATDAWLSQHGAAYGLCQIYENEPWHYELRADAAEHGCPAPYADPTDDPRLQ